jgi:hypothetical protein
MADEPSFRVYSKIADVNETLGLVFGWGIICTEDGVPYGDLQKDWIPPTSMVVATTDFMLHSRLTDEMHDASPDGVTVHSFPMTHEIAAKYDITTKREGWMIAVKPSPSVLAKFVSGEYTGFSIGGVRIHDEPYESAS